MVSLLGVGACSGPPHDAGAARQHVPAEFAGAATADVPDDDARSDPATLWKACSEDPSRVADCEKHVRLSRDDPSLPGRLQELAVLHPRHWVPSYLLGLRCHWRKEFAEAGSNFRVAIAAARAAGSKYGEGTALYALAISLEKSGDIARAEQLVLEARAPARLSGDRILQARVLRWLAMMRKSEGRYFDERPLRLELLALEDRERNDAACRSAVLLLAENARCLGLHREAEQGFHEALELARESGDTTIEIKAAMALGSLAVDENGDSGLSFLEAARAAAARGGRSDLEAYAEMLIGTALISLGRFQEARERLEANLSSPACERHELRYRTLVYLADAERLSGDVQAAFARYKEILARSARIALPEEERDALMGLAALHRARGEPEAAVRTARKAVHLVESMRSKIPIPSDRMRLLQIRSDTYRILAASLADRDPSNLAESFAAFEQAHARTLREVLSAKAPTSGDEGALTLPEVQGLLGPGDLLVDFLLGEEESSMIAVDAGRATFHALPPRRQLEVRIEAYLRALRRPLESLDARLSPESDFRRFAAMGHELFLDLLGPVADRVDDADRLIFVADRKLHRLPFEALLPRAPEASRPLEFLGSSFAVVYLPAASLLARTEAPAGGRVVILSAEHGGVDRELRPLRHAREEARAVANANPHDRFVLLEAQDATLSKLNEACSRPVSVLHLAAHAILDPVLGPRIALHGSDAQDNWFGQAEIARLPSAPRLVILSACDTAMGELVGGEGILGLVRAFTLAGSRNVIASQWGVDDSRTASMMGRLHREMRRGRRPSAAMRIVRSEVLAGGFVHPFFWAGFSLYGSD